MLFYVSGTNPGIKSLDLPLDSFQKTIDYNNFSDIYTVQCSLVVFNQKIYNSFSFAGVQIPYMKGFDEFLTNEYIKSTKDILDTALNLYVNNNIKKVFEV